ncbi:hydrolase [Endozoicomonas elysicola]|uniref:Acetylornithine deacetylase n=1 Tax=Endozoicomonas elysicola TaxID=305900 RepID=A0A081K8D3_9GAMM|nr:hydrolase [Endozoicomonas elysicola]KEI70409.1 acetylornithine deacetylase [Endozoicomonas elysicola]
MVKPTNSTLPPDVFPWLDLLNDQHDEMLNRTIELAEINSGSLNQDGVNQILEKLKVLTERLSKDQERISVPPWEVVDDNGETIQHPLGDALRVRKRPEAPLQVFMCGHMDTVFPKESPFQKVRWLDEETINGPGVTDLKGGILVMLKALEVLEQSPWAKHIGWEILFNPDEEIGSPGSAPLIEEAAQRVHFGMIFEPCFPDGNLAGQRKGSGNFTVVSHGKAAHAGREHHLGRNAIRALCDFISAMDDLNGQRPGITFNPGYIHGGGPTNIVPDRCIHKFNVRLEHPDDEQWCLKKLSKIIDTINQRDGIQLDLYGGFTRKPKVMSPANEQLLSLARSIGHELGVPLEIKPTGGCCDGNNLASAGIPNIDTLGVQGGAIHSEQEYLNVKSLVSRARLSAAILLTLAYNKANGDQLEWLTGGEK